jgi:hypothetical protein
VGGDICGADRAGVGAVAQIDEVDPHGCADDAAEGGNGRANQYLGDWERDSCVVATVVGGRCVLVEVLVGVVVVAVGRGICSQRSLTTSDGESFTHMPLRKMSVTHMPQKSSQIPV